jgi:predicted nucleic acid-binding Zn ribbon protein
MPADDLPGSTWVADGAREPQRLGASLDRVARRFGARSAGGMTNVFARWPEIVGAAAAAHATPVRLSGTTLHVQVDHAAWATQLAHLEATVLGRLDEVAGAGVVTAVRYRVGKP